MLHDNYVRLTDGSVVFTFLFFLALFLNAHNWFLLSDMSILDEATERHFYDPQEGICVLASLLLSGFCQVFCTQLCVGANCTVHECLEFHICWGSKLYFTVIIIFLIIIIVCI